MYVVEFVMADSDAVGRKPDGANLAASGLCLARSQVRLALVWHPPRVAPGGLNFKDVLLA
jgi:hypothetical protein